MSDMTEWLKQRRTIHARANNVLLRNSYEVEREIDSDAFVSDDTDAIVDAHNTLPSLLTAVEKVLELHKPVHQVFSWQAGGTTAYDPCETCHGKAGVHECGCWADKDLVYTCAECRDDKGRDIDWPCATVRAIEGAINER